jgi:hypothetical protein
VVKNTIVPGGSSLAAQTYSSLADVQKFITLRLFVVSGRVNNRWKEQEVFYNSCILLQIRFPTEKFQTCTYLLLLVVKSDSTLVPKFLF